MSRAPFNRQAGATLDDVATACIVKELKSHFGGGFSGERIIRDTEVEIVATTIWERLKKLLSEYESRNSGVDQ
jgi:hypothetical protein